MASKLSKFQVDLCISVTVLVFHLFTFFPLLPIFQIPERFLFQIPERFQAATKSLQLKWVGSGVLESTGTVLGLLALHSPYLRAEFLRLTDFCNGFIIWLKDMLFKSTVMQIEKPLINDRLRVSKIFWKFRIPNIYNFAGIYPWNLQFS